VTEKEPVPISAKGETSANVNVANKGGASFAAHLMARRSSPQRRCNHKSVTKLNTHSDEEIFLSCCFLYQCSYRFTERTSIRPIDGPIHKLQT
jgi:hypothetical protein